MDVFLMNTNQIWVFDVSKTNKRRFNDKRGVVRFRKAHITITWPDRHRS